MGLYRFSPIDSEAELQSAFAHITRELKKLSLTVLHLDLPVSILKIFPHYLHEYDYVYEQIKHKGKPASFNSQTSYYVHVQETIDNSHISYLGVRIVDPYRMQVGCGDYEVDNFTEMRKKYRGTSPFIRDAKDSSDMLEIWHPDFDVLGYIVPKK